MTRTEPLYAVGDVLESKAPEIMNSCHGAKITEVNTATQTYTVDRDMESWGFHHLHRNYQKKEDPVQMFRETYQPFKVGDQVRPKADQVGPGNYFTYQVGQPIVTVTGVAGKLHDNDSPLIHFEPGLKRYDLQGDQGYVKSAFADRFELVGIPIGVPQKTTAEPEDLTAFKLRVWQVAQATKDEHGWEDVIDEILDELGIQDPHPAPDLMEQAEIGTVVRPPREPQNLFLKTSQGWYIIWSSEPHWCPVTPGGEVEALLKQALEMKAEEEGNV